MTNEREQEPINPDALTMSITSRMLIEKNRYEPGTNPNQPPQVDEFALLLSAPLIEQAFLDPAKAGGLIASIYKLTRSLSTEPATTLSEDEQILKQAELTFTNALYDAMTDIFAEGFLEIVDEKNKAIEFARQRGVTPASIFDDEALYLEFTRITQTAEDYAAKSFSRVQKATQIMPGVFKSSLGLVVDEINGDNEVKDDGAKSFKKAGKAFANALFGDELDIQLEIEEKAIVATQNYERVALITLGKEVLRIWGQEAFYSLPQNIQNAILNAGYANADVRNPN